MNYCKVGEVKGCAICDASNQTKKEGKREVNSVCQRQSLCCPPKAAVNSVFEEKMISDNANVPLRQSLIALATLNKQLAFKYIGNKLHDC